MTVDYLNVFIVCVIWLGLGFLAGYLQSRYGSFSMDRQGVFIYTLLGFCALMAAVFEIIFDIEWWHEEAFKIKEK